MRNNIKQENMRRSENILGKKNNMSDSKNSIAIQMIERQKSSKSKKSSSYLRNSLYSFMGNVNVEKPQKFPYFKSSIN